MSRGLESDLQDDIAAPVIRPFLALHIDLPDPVWVWTGLGTLGFGGEEWIGIGGVASIDAIGESTDGSATGVTASLYQIPSEFREDIADQAVRGCLFELYVGSLDETYQVVRGTQLLWKGALQAYDIIDAGSTITVTATGESRAIDQRRPSIKRFTDEYQQRKYSGDKFFEYVPRMTEIPILWAKAEQASGQVSSGLGPFSGVFRANAV